MAYHSVHSSMIHGYDYDAETRDLVVHYKGGSQYTYTDVAPDLVVRLGTAESIGKFIKAQIKGHHAVHKYGGKK